MKFTHRKFVWKIRCDKIPRFHLICHEVSIENITKANNMGNNTTNYGVFVFSGKERLI